jgi:hypothetical protein
MLTPRQQLNAIRLYSEKHVPVSALATRYKVHRQSIYILLKRHNVDTTKRLFPVTCEVCGTEMMRHRYTIRNKKHVFCSQDCYVVFRTVQAEETAVTEPRFRVLAKGYFPGLQPENVIHHRDGRLWNNGKRNLVVYDSTKTHYLHHLGKRVKALWDGTWRS